eukprot:CAMPEP_0115125250 /NCGR_PEP_ID=MMETSP0227-20121206/48908_1 /TAXON_ID=89957 /ORGANISM="Polarella glacialis, Strain CCMP 1383" /LENGTH=72 /DNA_ID=CAMNT_0002528541 /DNA_START=101 /DNA_END=316 /DNA_ORIENTATION=-
MTAWEASRCAAATSGPVVVSSVVSIVLTPEAVKPNSETTSDAEISFATTPAAMSSVSRNDLNTVMVVWTRCD